MDQATISYYFKYIKDLQPKILYHENSNFLLFPNSERHIEVLASDLPVDKGLFHLESINITPFNGGNGRYREFLYTRV